MFEEQMRPFDHGDLDTGSSVNTQATVPCACCSPLWANLANTTNIDSEDLTDPTFWRRKNRCTDKKMGSRIFFNAKVLTVDELFSEATSLAIKNGKIVAVGDEEFVKASADEDAELIDCGGGIVLPGFIEPHMHFLPIVVLDPYENVGPFRCETVAEALKKLKEVAERSSPNEWIMGRQFDPSLQEGGDLLTRSLLDEVSTENPVFVYNASLHIGYCNSRALEIAGISIDTPDDPSSPYGRDAKGNPNGVLMGGKAIGSVIRHNSGQSVIDLSEGCLDVCAKANAVGVTTFCDQGTGLMQGVKELDIYKALAQSGSMTTRLRYSLSNAVQQGFDEYGVAFGDGDEVIRAAGWKIVSDGSNQGYSGLQREPYLGSEDKGIAYVEANDLKEMVLDRAEKGWPLVIHANGDQAIDNTLDAYEAAFDAGLLTNTPCRIEHCSILHDE
ncbi:MAG: amidohydrolase family protein, partial [Pseudomonadales bacterium]|nr:amidohydrolase family protein [Pseudomonadales bacterium]